MKHYLMNITRPLLDDEEKSHKKNSAQFDLFLIEQLFMSILCGILIVNYFSVLFAHSIFT